MKSDLGTKLESALGELNAEMQAKAKNYIQSLVDANICSFGDLIAAIQDGRLGIDLRMTACWLLGLLRDKRAVKGLLAAFQDDDIRLSWEASKSLGLIGGKRIVRPLISTLLEGSSVDKRAAAAYALGFVGDKRAVEPLLGVLLNAKEETKVREHATEALAHLGDNRAIEPLIDCLSDESPEVRFWSAYALGQLGDSRALVALKEVKATDHVVLPSWGKISDEAADAIEQIKLAKSG